MVNRYSDTGYSPGSRFLLVAAVVNTQVGNLVVPSPDPDKILVATVRPEDR